MCALFHSERLALKYFKRLRLFLPIVADHANTTGLSHCFCKAPGFPPRHSCRPAFSLLLNIQCFPAPDLLETVSSLKKAFSVGTALVLDLKFNG